MAELILHHYDTSPFSEKVRVMLGLKGLAWRSVIQPVIMPKPDLTPLTGGYRRIPVMQVGADVFCDSQVILEEIEQRHPEPRLVTGADWAVNMFCDRQWFQASVAVVFARLGESVPRAFIEDREKLSGRPFDIQGMQAAEPFARAQWLAYAGWVEQALETGPCLGGATPSLADVAAWMPVWWAGGAAPDLLEGLERLAAWRERMVAVGHGGREEMTPAEALEVARAAQPRPAAVAEDDPSRLRGGDHVTVQADDYGRDPVQGRLAGLTPTRVTVAREAADLGLIHVHFPRAGYVLARS